MPYFYLRFEGETEDGWAFVNAQKERFVCSSPPPVAIQKLVEVGQCVLLEGSVSTRSLDKHDLIIDRLICNTGSVERPFSQQCFENKTMAVIWECDGSYVTARVTATPSGPTKKKKPVGNNAGLVVWRTDATPQWMTLPMERLLYVGEAK